MSAEATRMVTALGALLGWRGALLIGSPGAETGGEVLRRWAAQGQDAFAPAWVHDLGRDSWAQGRLLWRSPVEWGECSAVAVPVHVDGLDNAGADESVLCFYGPELRRPDAATVGLLEAVADMVGRPSTTRPSVAARADAEDTFERAISMVDVFAYTVSVGDRGELQWRYVGPNADAVLGQRVTEEESLSALVMHHSHAAEQDAVSEFTQAVVEGRALDTTLRFVGQDGTTRWVSWRTRPRRVQGTLYADGVATDVSARVAMERSRQEYAQSRRRHLEQAELLRHQAAAVRDANDNVLQRIFAAGLRLQMLTRTLSEVEAHAATAIAFQLDQAATDLREVILSLNALASDSRT